MLEFERKYLGFRIKEIHFSNHPYDVKGCDALFFFSCKNNVTIEKFIRHEIYTSVLDLNRDLNTIWMNNLGKNCRYKIRKAQQLGINCLINERYKEYVRIQDSFERQKGFSPIFRMIRPKLKTIKQYGTLFVSEYQGEVLSGLVYLEDGNNIKAWLAASKRLEVDKEKATLIGYANRLLLWEAIKYAKGKGIKEFDFGGLWSEEKVKKDKQKEGLNRFKMDFGGEIVTRYYYIKINSLLYKLAKSLYYIFNHVIYKKIDIFG